MSQLPEELESTGRMLEKAFPMGIGAEDFESLGRACREISIKSV
jgi:hypothetical protein